MTTYFNHTNRQKISVYAKISARAHGNFAPCPQKPTHSGRDEGRSSHREQEQVPPKARRGHGRGEVCRYSWGRAPITFIIFAKYEQQQSISDPLGRRRNRSAQATYPLPQGEGLRSDARPQRRRRYRSRTDPELRPHLPRREHAGDYRPGCPAAHQGATPLPPRHYDHQERGGRADEPSHRR